MIDTHRLKDLETLVGEAAKLLKSLGDENAKLAKAVARLDEENKHLREDVRRYGQITVRHDKLRSRLERLSQKLAKLG